VNLDKLKEQLLGDWNRDSSSVETTALTLIGPKLLDELRDMIEGSITVPGHIVETGVWRGGACIWAAAVLESLGSDKLVYACDSFEGLPPVTSPKETISYDDAESLRVSQEEVEANFDRFGLKHRAVFVKGWFKDTMPTLDIPVSVLRLDGDMYESTDDVLRHMYDRVSPGGYVIVDDYQLPSCKQAVDELRSRKRLRGKLPVRAGVWWQKPPTTNERN
jgi:O-methyltransferase